MFVCLIRHKEAVTDCDHALRALGVRDEDVTATTVPTPKDDKGQMELVRQAIAFTSRAASNFHLKRAMATVLKDVDAALTRNRMFLPAWSLRARVHDAMGMKDQADEDRRSAAVITMKMNQNYLKQQQQ